MTTPPTVEALQQQIAALEAELARVRPLVAAAQEAYAFFVGRRPGFAPTYGRDVLVAAFEPHAPRPQRGGSRRASATKRRKQS